MAKKGEGWFWILVGGGLLAAVLYSQKGSRLRADVNAVVAELNRRYGKQWVGLGATVLKAYLRTTPLAPALKAFDAVYAVEQMAQRAQMSGTDKQAEAVRRLGS
jgi:hypothetical protein